MRNKVKILIEKTPAPLRRFLRYTLPGSTSTIVDFAILIFLTEVLNLHYLVSGAIAFTISTSFNYQINHFWGFKRTRREFKEGYIYFFIFGVAGLVLTIGILAFFVEVLVVNYVLARFIAALFVGIWNYVMNIKFTFQSTLLGKD